jgi:hypothetical protein
MIVHNMISSRMAKVKYGHVMDVQMASNANKKEIKQNQIKTSIYILQLFRFFHFLRIFCKSNSNLLRIEFSYTKPCYRRISNRSKIEIFELLSYYYRIINDNRFEIRR